MSELGDFSAIKNFYSEGRRGVPAEVMDYLILLLPLGSRVLDIGCGTGISSRQLKEVGFSVIGVDKYPEMLDEAKKYKDGIQYLSAPAEDLPFDDSMFDGVTAFSSLHWFANDVAGTEIRRVLRPGALFISVNRSDVAGFRKRGNAHVKQFLGRDEKSPFNPVVTLREMGFKNTEARVFSCKEIYPKEDALNLLLSSAWWVKVPDKNKAELRVELAEIIEEESQGRDTVVRDLDFIVASGT